MIGAREKSSGEIFSSLHFSATFAKIVQKSSSPVSTILMSPLGIHSMISFREFDHKSTPSKPITSVIIKACGWGSLMERLMYSPSVSYNDLNDAQTTDVEDESMEESLADFLS